MEKRRMGMVAGRPRVQRRGAYYDAVRPRTIAAAPMSAFPILLLAAVLDQIAALRAVPADEFAPAIPLFLARPYLRPAALLLLLVHLVQSRRSVPLPRRLGLGAAGLAALVPPLLLPAVFAAVLLDPRSRIPALRAPASRSAGPGRSVGQDALAVLAGGLGAIALDLGSLALRLPAPLREPRTLLLAGGLLSQGILTGLIGLLLVVRLARAIAGSARDPTASIALQTALATAAFLGWTFFGCLGDEVATLGLAPHALAALLLAGAAVQRHFQLLAGRVGPEALLLDPGAGAWASLWPPSIGRAAGSPGRGAALAAASAAALALLVLHPEVEDLRLRIYPAAALLLLLAAVRLGHHGVARLPSRAPVWFAAIAIAGGGMVAIDPGMGTTRLAARILVAESSRLGTLVPRAAEEASLRVDPPRPKGALPAWLETPPWAVQPRSDRPPIVVILWDAARPDRLGLHGHARPTTPHLDRFAAHAAIFTRAYANATATTLSVRQMLSGTYASRHMLDPGHPPFLVRELARGGWTDCVITVTGSDYNGISAEAFRRGLGPAGDGLRWHEHHRDGADTVDRDAETCAYVAATWERLAAERSPPSLDGTFSFIHLTSPHAPWFNEEPVADFGTSAEARYDGELAKADQRTGLLLDALARLDPAGQAIVVLVADHGTGLGERGRHGGFLPYEEQVRIPLILRVPGVAPRRIEEPVAALDLAPTLLHLAGLPDPGRFHGRSLAPLLSGDQRALEPRIIVMQNAFDDAYAILAPGGRWKLHLNRRLGLAHGYDLEADPGEFHPQPASGEPFPGLLLELQAWLAAGAGSFAHPYHYRP